MSAVSRNIDRLDTIFDHDNLVANAGLILAGTLMVRLGLEVLINRWVKTGSARPGRKILTVVAAMMAGGTHIDHVDVLRAGATGRVLPFRPMAPSTIGTFLRTFTFGHIRQLDAVMSRVLARAWHLGAGPGSEPLVIDLDSTICEVRSRLHHLRSPRKEQAGRRLRLHQTARLSPSARDTSRHRRDLVRSDAQRLRRIVTRCRPLH